jgi:hypothetical protein
VTVPAEVKETAEKVENVSFNWAKLISRIYEVNPLICSNCGKEIKIIAFITHSSQIWRILRGIGWPADIPEFDSEYDLHTYEVCQLIPGTADGFPEIECQVHPEIGPDPPCQDCLDPVYEGVDLDSPYWEDHSDPPHWED